MSSNSLAGVRNVVSLLTLTTALCFAFPAAAETIAAPAAAGSAELVPLQAQSGEQEADTAPPALSDLERADSLLQAVSLLSDSAFALAERIPGTRGEDRALLGQRIRRLVAEGEALTGPLLITSTARLPSMRYSTTSPSISTGISPAERLGSPSISPS